MNSNTKLLPCDQTEYLGLVHGVTDSLTTDSVWIDSD